MVFLKRQRIVYDIERNARGGKKMHKKFRRTGAVALALAMAVTMLPGSISKAYTLVIMLTMTITHLVTMEGLLFLGMVRHIR